MCSGSLLDEVLAESTTVCVVSMSNNSLRAFPTVAPSLSTNVSNDASRRSKAAAAPLAETCPPNTVGRSPSRTSPQLQHRGRHR